MCTKIGQTVINDAIPLVPGEARTYGSPTGGQFTVPIGSTCTVDEPAAGLPAAPAGCSWASSPTTYFTSGDGQTYTSGPTLTVTPTPLLNIIRVEECAVLPVNRPVAASRMRISRPAIPGMRPRLAATRRRNAAHIR